MDRDLQCPAAMSISVCILITKSTKTHSDSTSHGETKCPPADAEDSKTAGAMPASRSFLTASRTSRIHSSLLPKWFNEVMIISFYAATMKLFSIMTSHGKRLFVIVSNAPASSNAMASVPHQQPDYCKSLTCTITTSTDILFCTRSLVLRIWSFLEHSFSLRAILACIIYASSSASCHCTTVMSMPSVGAAGRPTCLQHLVDHSNRLLQPWSRQTCLLQLQEL